MIENQLFAPTLKGVIDFGYAKPDGRDGLGSSHPLGLGANEEPTKRWVVARKYRLCNSVN